MSPLARARHALHRRRTERAFAREMRAKYAETLAAMEEVGILKETVRQRLDRTLAAVAERDAWIYSDEDRAKSWETWRASRMRAAADRARGERP